MKKNNTAEKTILEAEQITKALKEGTEKNLRDIVKEAISNLVAESEDEEDPEKEDSYDVEDVNTEETPAVADNETEAPEGEEDFDDAEGEEGGEDGSEEGDADDEWSDDMEQYKVGDNDYDFTGVEGDEILKVYNKLGDDDQIFVKKEDDGTYSVKDDETGAEFVIELDPDALDADADETEDFSDDVDDASEGDDEVEFDFGGEDDEEPESDDEIEINLGDEDEDEDTLNEENLGYTDSYQKDVFDKKFNMNEPADSKTTNDWDAGVPKGSEKPWAGKGNSKPFEKKVNECGPVATSAEPVVPEQEANLEEDGSGLNTKHANKKSTNHINRKAQNQRQSSENGDYKALRESAMKIYEKAKAIQAENKQYRECINKIKQSLYEAAVLNVNMGKLVDILVNETTTKEEKKRICERFNNVKTLSEGKALHAAIKEELKESVKSSPIVEKQFVAEAKNLNENVIFENTNNPSLDLMTRMDNLFKKNK
jgi:hypothetical protein